MGRPVSRSRLLCKGRLRLRGPSRVPLRFIANLTPGGFTAALVLLQTLHTLQNTVVDDKEFIFFLELAASLMSCSFTKQVLAQF